MSAAVALADMLNRLADEEAPAFGLPEAFLALAEIGRDVLAARDVADFRTRLDGAIMRLRDLGPLPRPSADVLEALPAQPREGSIFVRTVGLDATQKFLQAFRELAPIYRATPLLDSGDPRGALAARALRVRPWSLHDGEVVPHTLVRSAITAERGAVAVGALLCACAGGRHPEPWLSNALADTFLASVREIARLMASAGLDVSVRPVGPLLDLPGLFREAEEADGAFLAALDREIDAGHVGVPEDAEDTDTQDE